MSGLLASHRDRVLRLTLNRPQARSALSNALLTRIADTLESAATDAGINVYVISGNMRYFAAGADLNKVAEKDLSATFDGIRPHLWACISAFNKSLIAVVNGYALSAGCELMLLCDLVIIGDGMRFDLPEIILGTMLGAGGTQRLIRRVDKALVSRVVLDGESIDTGRARRAGLVSDIHPANLSDEYALKLAAIIARHSPLTLRTVKQFLRAAQEMGLQAGPAQECQLFTLLNSTEDRREDVSASLDKRTPELKGRQSWMRLFSAKWSKA